MFHVTINISIATSISNGSFIIYLIIYIICPILVRNNTITIHILIQYIIPPHFKYKFKFVSKGKADNALFRFVAWTNVSSANINPSFGIVGFVQFVFLFFPFPLHSVSHRLQSGVYLLLFIYIVSSPSLVCPLTVLPILISARLDPRYVWAAMAERPISFQFFISWIKFT